MKLILADDNGVVLDSWYIPDEETTMQKIRAHLEDELPVFLDRKEYEAAVGGE